MTPEQIASRIALKHVLRILGIKSAQGSLFEDIYLTIMRDFGRPDEMILSPNTFNDLKKLIP